MPKPTLDQRLATLDAAQQRYFAHGYTHAQDGATLFGDIAFFTGAAARERLKIDLALLPLYTGLDKLLADPDLEFGVYRGHAKLQGIKFILDGSVQARTGYRSEAHTSELQSLMRISYAVFCLNNKNKLLSHTTQHR